jgi:hypothetical protein
MDSIEENRWERIEWNNVKMLAQEADTIPLLSQKSSSTNSNFFLQEKRVRPLTTDSLKNQVRALKTENFRLKKKVLQYLETIQGFLKKEPTLSEHI